jgi:hypothetical protein
MNTARKFVHLAATAIALSAFSATVLAHPGHLEQGKKGQKRTGKQAVNAEKTGELVLFTARNDAVDALNP